MEYWLGVLQAQIPTVMEKAVASEAHSKGALTLTNIDRKAQSSTLSCYQWPC